MPSFLPSTLYVVVYVWKSLKFEAAADWKTTVFLNVYRDEDEQQFGVEQEEAEKGKRIYHKELLDNFCFYWT